MKKLIFTLLASGVLVSAQAQVFNPDSVGGALFGAGLGAAIAGSQHHGNPGQGAAIGAASGFLLGSLTHQANQNSGYYGYAGYNAYPAVSFSYGYGHPGYRYGYRYGYGYGRPYWNVGFYGGYPGYYYPYAALAYPYYAAPAYAPAPAVTQPPAAPQQQPQQAVTIINNYYNTTPMSSANGLFGR